MFFETCQKQKKLDITYAIKASMQTTTPNQRARFYFSNQSFCEQMATDLVRLKLQNGRKEVRKRIGKLAQREQEFQHR